MTGRGRLNAGTPMRVRLEHYTDRTGDCWVWVGAIDRVSGYGRLQVDGTCGYAHRESYKVFVGPIPKNRQIDHLCRNRACCNPDHLEAVSAQINVRRGESPGARARRRDMCFHGVHLYAEFGFEDRQGRRHCRECQRQYAELWRGVPAGVRELRKREGAPVVDLAAYYAEVARLEAAA